MFRTKIYAARLDGVTAIFSIPLRIPDSTDSREGTFPPARWTHAQFSLCAFTSVDRTVKL
ncbi:hypothetical protein AU252_00215 [Pseudarthrobacter sulfonivorans]|uniref:Uncharacterized protein n=1 Tax=Pseudarthrobacter sulfonivorans TaxID=121292 RepID=A0A0U3QHL7_9MICC|nr:hypothetical protein AU252_00215 [Pseudarthrobacter sulfonivorans]